MLIFGAPGVGKGTFGRMIVQHFKFGSFAMGDYIRNMIKNRNQDAQSESGKKFGNMEKTISGGNLIDDQYCIDTVKDLHEKPESFMKGMYNKIPGLLLDGVPRTVK